jgi:hypothetical protein
MPGRASALVVAAYAKSTPHSSGFARLAGVYPANAGDIFTELSKFNKICLVEKKVKLL